MKPQLPHRIPLLGAPTASGKTSVAIELALLLSAEVTVEVVTADAMQVYAGMDIGTAKPSPEEQAGVPHHLLDLVTPAEEFSVADWVAAAEETIARVLERGSLPFVVGGTGFYLRSLTDGLPLVPRADRAVQEQLEAELAERGLPALKEELRAAAPADDERAGLNPRRVVRALEIVRRTGRAPSAFGRSEPRFRYCKAALLPDPAQLDPRIAARSRHMFDHGLVAEVEQLSRRWPVQATALQAIGYREVLAHLRGETTLAEAEEAVLTATRQYARRQLTWFRKEPDTRLFPGLAAANRDSLAEWLITCFSGRDAG
ncbi:MAG TPA: tRNA (adenosine(37)-N6)-dimethylallyltransferase MiaA [Deinococcales bacterium]|nr:tRNA (adenosine(37)-N6)-dimethylallyltransferase MiaA [Deinococcales bacterium]